MSGTYEKKPGSRVEKVEDGLHRVIVYKDKSSGGNFLPEQNLEKAGYVLDTENSDALANVWKGSQSAHDQKVKADADKSEKLIRTPQPLDMSGIPSAIGARSAQNSVDVLENYGGD